MNIDISVIIPVYNSSKTIVECINSVLKEIKDNNLTYEILIINDGSTDSSEQIITSNFTDLNIKIFTQKNSGPSVARNKGLEIAIGKYIAFIDSDDKWLKGKLKEQISFLNNNMEIDFIGCNITEKSQFKITSPVTLKKQIFHNYFYTSTVLLKNKVKNYFNFDANMKYSEDMNCFIKAMYNCNGAYIPFYGCTNVFSKRSFGESGLSANLKEMEKGELFNIKYIYKQKSVSLLLYICAVLYSKIKYLRRILISKR